MVITKSMYIGMTQCIKPLPMQVGKIDVDK